VYCNNQFCLIYYIGKQLYTQEISIDKYTSSTILRANNIIYQINTIDKNVKCRHKALKFEQKLEKFTDAQNNWGSMSVYTSLMHLHCFPRTGVEIKISLKFYHDDINIEWQLDIYLTNQIDER
jgi:hypothetical protein